MVPKVNGQNIQFLVIYPSYENDKFIKENYLKVWMSKGDINAYGEYVGSKGIKLKTRSKIYNRSTNSYSNVAHSLKELEEALGQTKVGYKTNRNDF